MPYEDRKPPKETLLPVPPPETLRLDADLAIMRALVELMGIPKHCTTRCRRAKACTHPMVACFDANIEAFHEFAEGLVTWTRLDGERDREDCVRAAKDFFD